MRTQNRHSSGWITVVLVVCLSLPVLANTQVPAAPQEAPVLLRGGTLFTVSDGVLEETDLLFVNGVIENIGKGLKAPAGAKVIDVSGQNVYPGLIALGTSVGLVEIGAVRATRDQRETGDVTPEVTAHTAFNYDSEILPTLISNGVTMVQSVPSGGLIFGRGFVTYLDGWTKEDAGVRPIDGLHMSWPRASIIRAWWMRQSEEDQRKQMLERRETIRRVFDEARAYDQRRDVAEGGVIDTRWEAMRPLFSREQPLWVSANDARQIEEAVAFAAEQDLDLIIVGGNEAWRVAELLKSRDIPVVLQQMHSTPVREDDDYDLPYKQPSLLAKSGVRFAIAKMASWDVRNLPFQAGQSVAFGLSSPEALRAITLTPAELLGIDHRVGSLEVGKEATLIVSEGDVMDYLGHRVTRVWISGRSISLNDRHKQLRDKYRTKIERTN
jgi:imidazolonepropionase-like amidohydrolase